MTSGAPGLVPRLLLTKTSTMAMQFPLHSGMTLKALLENPDLQHPPVSFSNGNNCKDKKSGSGEPEIDFSSAFLGPHLWEKTYDASDFNLEYMDLDEFLCENGIPIVDDSAFANLSPATPHVHSPQNVDLPSPVHSPATLTDNLSHQVCPSQTVVLPESPAISSSNFLTLKAEVVKEASSPRVKNSAQISTGESTPPLSPVPVHVDFSVSEQDLALVSIPGHSEFNPRMRNFSDEELRPQPMIKKSRKIYVPDDMKDDRYWTRRKKNNCAAKRSRDARRVKENQIAMRAAYLEKENTTLKVEMEKLRRDNAKLKQRLMKYEPGEST